MAGDKSTVQKHVWPTDLLQQIRKTVEKPSRQMQTPELAFKLTKECAQKNFLVYKKYDLNLEHALAAHTIGIRLRVQNS